MGFSRDQTVQRNEFSKVPNPTPRVPTQQPGTLKSALIKGSPWKRMVGSNDDVAQQIFKDGNGGINGDLESTPRLPSRSLSNQPISAKPWIQAAKPKIHQY